MIRFEKWHALQNDFLIVDGRERLVGDPGSMADFACDRRSGVGGDGVVLIVPSDRATIGVRIFNADGSEAEISGNGFRCAAAYLMAGEGRSEGEVTVEGLAGISRHMLERVEGGVATVRSLIPPPSFEAADIPVKAGGGDPAKLAIEAGGRMLEVSCVSVGNPHAVLFDGWDEGSWEVIGKLVETHPMFPERTNVEFVRHRTGDQLDVFLWERGVGRTASSGTGAAASFAAARKRGMVGRQARVTLEGGTLSVAGEPDGIAVTGTCEPVFRGEFEWPRSRKESQ